MKLQLLLILFGWTMQAPALAGTPRLPQPSLPSISSPLFTEHGVVCTSDRGSSLFVIENGIPRHLLSLPGCGRYYTISPKGDEIGLKTFDSRGGQSPAILNITDGTVKPLNGPVRVAGQPSFTQDNQVAFTIGNELVVRSLKGQRRFNLGGYANLAPISPNGTKCAYNDQRDQIWVLDLSTARSKCITDSSLGYYFPLWAPDSKHLLYSSLHGQLHVYNLETEHTSALGEGYGPSWSGDSRWVVFYRQETDGKDLINSDLWLASPDGSLVVQLTDSPAVFEAYPSFLGDMSGAIGYCDTRTNAIMTAEISPTDHALRNVRTVFQADVSWLSRDIPSEETLPLHASSMSALDMPYINQVYDTPDWYNGHWACGPTTAMMVLAYYHVLPRWDVRCSWPSPGHISPYGQYICEQYNFNQRTYSALAADPNGRPAAGGYGFMWSSGSPHSMMASYYSLHGIPALTGDSPPHSAAVAELTAGYPYTLCVGLTTAGHIVAAIGMGSESHTLIVNDPYGNKNLGTYPNYYGKSVPYDWPGYNNGNQNFNTVYWSTTTHGVMPARGDTLVDDLQFDNGFYLHTQAPASMSTWKDLKQGFMGHMWYTITKREDSPDSCYALWRPNLPQAGTYEVLAYITFSNAVAARYIVSHSSRVDTVLVSQKDAKDQWVSLGRYRFPQGDGSFVRLGDASPVRGQEIVFDAIRWSRLDTTTTDLASTSHDVTPETWELNQNYPNPFNPSTSVRFTLHSRCSVLLKVYDLLGKEIRTLLQAEKGPGSHEVTWDGLDQFAKKVGSGLYFCRLQATRLDGSATFTQTIKMLSIN